MGEYNYILHHKLGITNRADALSRRPDYPVVNRQQEEQLLDNAVFANNIQVQEIDQIIKKSQNTSEIEPLCKKYGLELREGIWQQQGRIVVVGNNDLK